MPCTVQQNSLLIGISVGVGPINRVAAAFDIPLIGKKYHCSWLEFGVKRVEKGRDLLLGDM